MENQTENIAGPHGQKGLVALVAAVIILVLAVLGLGTVYFMEMTQAKDLKRQVDDLKTAAAQMDEEMAKDAKTVKPAGEYREIPELGVKYEVTDETKGLTYTYINDTTNTTKSVRFTTIDLASQKDSKGEFPCVSHMPSGIITRYEGEGAPKPSNDPRMTVKQVGSLYYFYAGPEVACMVDNQDVPNFQKSVDAVKAVYDSLKAM